MRWKAEQSDHAPEAKVSWNFYKECLGRAKTKYGYIAPRVIEKFPDLGLETFD